MRLNGHAGLPEHLFFAYAIMVIFLRQGSYLRAINSLHTVCFMYGLSIYEKRDMSPRSILHNLTLKFSAFYKFSEKPMPLILSLNSVIAIQLLYFNFK